MDKIDKTKVLDYYMSKDCSYCHNFVLRFRCPPTLGGNLVQTTVLWGHAGCPLSKVERCPLLAGSKYTIPTGIAIGGTFFVRCTKVVRFFGGSPIRGFTVYGPGLSARPDSVHIAIY